MYIHISSRNIPAWRGMLYCVSDITRPTIGKMAFSEQKTFVLYNYLWWPYWIFFLKTVGL